MAIQGLFSGEVKIGSLNGILRADDGLVSATNITSGTSGTSGINGTSGTSGISGTSGATGTSGTSGLTGTSGTSGATGVSGTSGTSGVSPSTSGFVTVAGTQTITGIKTFTSEIRINTTDVTGGVLNLKRGAFIGPIPEFTSVFSEGDGLSIASQTGATLRYAKFDLSGLTSGTTRTYALPNANGTLALTSDIPSPSTFVPYTGATASVDLGLFNSLTAYNISGKGLYAILNGTTSSPLVLKTGSGGVTTDTDAISLVSSASSARTLSIYFDIAGVSRKADFNANSLTATRTYTLPDASGTIALTSDIPSPSTFVPYTGATANVDLGVNTLFLGAAVAQGTLVSNLGVRIEGNGISSGGNLQFKQYASVTAGALGYTTMSATGSDSLNIYFNVPSTSNYKQVLLSSALLTNNITRTYSFPNASGTIALTSDIPSPGAFVPYTGATSNIALGEYGLSGGYIGLDTTPTSTPTTVGTLSWDTTYLTPKVITGTGNTTLQIGQEEVILIHNGTGSALTDGQVVYVTGSTGDLPSVSLADASSETTSAATLGVVTEPIANGSNGFVTVSGMVNGLNTLAYNEGDLLWLSETAGAFTNVKPISPAHLVLIGYVIKKAGGNGSILVKIQNTQELEECSDVLFTSLANNDILAYESSTDLWKNKTIAAVLGYTPQAQLTLTTTGTSGAATLTGSTLNIPNYTTDLSGYVPYTGATANVDLGAFNLTSTNLISKQLTINTTSNYGGSVILESGSLGVSGSATNGITLAANSNTEFRVTSVVSGSQFRFANFNLGSIGNGQTRTYTLPDATGTLALTSDLSAYLPLSGGTLTGDLTINNGSADGGQLILASSGYSNWNIDNFSGRFRAYYGSTEYFTINASGYVGIGTSSPANKLDVQTSSGVGSSTASGLARFITADSSTGVSVGQANSARRLDIASYQINVTGEDFYLTNNGANAIVLGTNFNERMRITSGGLVGMGTSSPSYPLDIQNGSDFDVRIRGNSAGGTVGLLFETANTFSGTSQAYIKGIGSAGNGTSQLIFGTAGSSGDTTATERMRINSAGGVDIKNISTGSTGLGMSSPNSYSGIHINAASLSTASVGWYHFVGQSGNGSTITTNNILIYGNGNVANANNVYSAISDISLKENITDATPKLSDLLKVKIRNYNLISDENKEKQLGVIAQELEEIFPNMISEGKQFGTDETIKTVKYSVFVPMLIKAIQEQQAQIEELKALINK